MAENEPPIEKTTRINIEEEMRVSYLDYAMSVIIGRALPDVRDGLKPVHRRILYGMYEQGNTAGKAYKKSARIVGDVMGKYHPHGDSAIYDTVVRMAQEFAMRHTLVDGQGNFGSIDGDNPAAMRYTEVRLTRLAEELLRDDIDKETIDWVPNYDGSLEEPLVLPAKFPNLLVNGSAGIAVGMATNIPPHNLGEVVDACLLLIENPRAGLDEILEVLPGPDFPTAGFIHGMDGIRQAYMTGRGSVQMRARATIEEPEKEGERWKIVVNEIPYQTNKARLIEKIAELVKEKRLEGIADIRDESDRDGIRIVIEVKRGEVPEVILNYLYKNTAMQSSFGINMTAIVDNQPRVLDVQSMLRYFLDHRREIVVRRTRYDLKKAEERAHILEGLTKALDHLDAIIKLIRASGTPEEARQGLVDSFDLSVLQAQAILDMRLQRLTGLEREKIISEYQEVRATIERLRSVLGSEALVLEIIADELREVKEKFADPRRTKIIEQTREITIEDMIAEEDMVITVSRGGYVKRSPLSLYRAQRRGGKGRTGMTTKEEDIVEHLFVASTHSYMLVFTDKGRVYWIKVHQLPSVGPAARGKAIVNLLQLSKEENVRALLTVRDFGEAEYVVLVTRKGRIKKTPLDAFSNPRTAGIYAITLNEDDDLHAALLTDGQSEIFIGSRHGKAIRFPETDVRPMGRTAAGVRGIRLRNDDYVVEADVLAPGSEGQILSVTDRGFGKRTAISAYRLQSRGGSGVINVRTTEKNGRVAGITCVREGDEVLLISEWGKLIRFDSSSIRSVGRATQGVKVLDVDEGDRIVGAVKLVEREEDQLDAGETAEAAGEESPAEPVN
ncbi:MAG: DNA gyrase subunit A [Acidobacteria bacterium]|nr:DNA gyrase subunit A [Acidobacteriota bacterium]